MLTETGLDDSINDLQLFGQNYTVYRCDRNLNNSLKTSFGGVLIAVSNQYASSKIETKNGLHIEQISVTANIRGRKFFMCTVYIPPDRSRDASIFDAHLASLNELTNLTSDDDILIACGDYNLPHINWNSQDEGFMRVGPSSNSLAAVTLIDGIDFLNLLQRNFIRNHLDRILDLVFSAPDSHIDIYESATPLLPVDPHHPPLEMFINVAAENLPVNNSANTNTERLLNYAKADFPALNEFISGCDWNLILRVGCVNDMASNFCSTIRDWLEVNTPKQRPRRSPAWDTPLLRSLRRDKNSCQRKLRRIRSPDTKRNFQRASNAYRSLNSSLYKSHVLRVQNNLRRNPRSFWNFVNSKRKNSNIPSTVFLRESESASVSEACELFAKHFASVFSPIIASSSDAVRAAAEVPVDLINLRNFAVSPTDVANGIKKLKNSFIPGLDRIPAVVLRRCSATITVPLSKIFTASLEQGIFPEIWKHSIMFPVYKKGDKRDVSNYRGITSPSASSKLFEIVVNDVIFFHVKSYIAPTQHGFMTGRSVMTNLIEFTSTCINHMEAGLQVDSVYTDLKAAFDRIDHRILLYKLSRLGVSCGLIAWLSSYLSNRTLRVKLDSCLSIPFIATSGVPQGSNLGPLLFSLYFNDVTFILPYECALIYADDLKMYAAIQSTSDCQRLQRMLEIFVNWCQVNHLTVSIGKCKVITFHRTKTPIEFSYSMEGLALERVYQINDLGVLLDSKLSFDLHRSTMITKANRQLGFISKISKDFRDPYCLKALYCSLVRPILESSSLVWTPYQLTWCLRIERVQKRFIRQALRHLPWRDPVNLPPYADRCRLLNLDTLERRRKVLQATFVVKLMNAEIDSPRLLSQLNFRAPSRSLRYSNLMQLGTHRTSFGYYEPITGMLRTFSEVEELFEFGETSSSFKRKVYNSSAF